MAKSDISFLWPLTGLSFVFATFAAIWFLNERVSAVRWIGVVLIVIGAAFISYSQHVKEKPAPPTPAARRKSRQSYFGQNRRQLFCGKPGFLLQLHQRADFPR